LLFRMFRGWYVVLAVRQCVGFRNLRIIRQLTRLRPKCRHRAKSTTDSVEPIVRY
jgi:hypothetical protein